MANSKSLSLSLFLFLLSFPSSHAHLKPPPPPAPPKEPPPITPPQPSPEAPPKQTPETPSKPTLEGPPMPPIDYRGCFSKVYAFGDSYTDTGNAFLLGGLKSFISALLSHFPLTPFGPKLNLDKGRICDGRLVVDFLCESLSLPYLNPYKKVSADFSSGVNFAIAGSTSLSADFFIKKLISHTLMWQAVPLNFNTQIDWYTKYLESMGCKAKDDAGCKAMMEKGLFWVGGMGMNDFTRIIGTSISARWLTQNTISHTCNILETLLAKGAKYLVVQGLPPIGCLPVCLLLSPPNDRDDLGCAARINSVISAHNDLLQKKLSEFRRRFPSANLIYADYWSAYRSILINATITYEFKEKFKACCGTGGGQFNFKLGSICGAAGTGACDDPSKHIVWDGVHLTESMHKKLSYLFLHRGFCKPSFSDMIVRRKKAMG